MVLPDTPIGGYTAADFPAPAGVPPVAEHSPMPPTASKPRRRMGALLAAAFLASSQTKCPARSLVQDSGAPAWLSTAARDLPTLAARVQLELQRLGHQIPSSFSMVRRSGRLRPTTLW